MQQLHVTCLRDVPEFLEKYEVPQNPDVIKIDIDSFDCDLLEAFLRRREFKLIYTEINYEIPVPFMFSRKWSPGIKFCMRPFGFYGCSLSYQVHMMAKYGYVLLQLCGYDATFVHEKYTSAFPKARFIDYVTYFYSTLKIQAGLQGKTTGHLKHPKRKWRWRSSIMEHRLDDAWNGILDHFSEAANDCAARKLDFGNYNSALKGDFAFKGLISASSNRTYSVNVLGPEEVAQLEGTTESTRRGPAEGEAAV